MTQNKQLRGRELFERQADNTRFDGPGIICDGIQTPENFGAILRVADAAGCKHIILLDSDLDLKSKKLCKLARSTQQHLDITSLETEAFIQQSSFKHLIALEITEQSYNLYESNIADCDGIIIGHESKGVSEELLALCNQSIHIPMYGINSSMNLSHALALCAFEWRRQLNEHI